MTLQSENGAPSFYVFASYRPGRSALIYGGLLSILAFCAVTFVFNYGIKEKLWSFAAVQEEVVTPSSADVTNNSSVAPAAPQNIGRVALPESILRSLPGTYFSAVVNRKYLISLQRGQLSLQIDGGNRIELIPVSADTLYAGEGRLIKFATAPAGSIDKLDLYDHGRHIAAARQ